MKTSNVELVQLFKSWILVSLAFTFALYGFDNFLIDFGMSLIIIGTAFILHELAHKFVAQRYGLFAEFRSFDEMLFLALLISFLGVLFAAPGAVMISGRVTREQNGIISAAGPAMNIIIAILSLLVISFFNPLDLFGRMFLINSWLALFNLLPVWQFDGKKVIGWHKGVYAFMVLVSLGFVVSSFLI